MLLNKGGEKPKMENYNYEDYLSHAGIKGMKWGVRRYQNKDGTLTAAGKKHYRSTGVRSALAKRANDKVDKSFNDWKENTKKKEDAIALGKQMNKAKMAYENDKSNKTLKADYKQANKDYKKALKENTTYRKGVVKQEVGRDISRKYLSEAKKVKKQLDSDPTNKDAQKKYNSLMSKHDVERAKARRATEVSTKRSRKIASIKRTMTITAKAAAGTAVVAGGTYAVNKYLTNHNVTLNGKTVQFNTQKVGNVVNVAKRVKNLLGFI